MQTDAADCRKYLRVINSGFPPVVQTRLLLRFVIRDEKSSSSDSDVSSQTARGNRTYRRAYLVISYADGPEVEARPAVLLISSPIVG
jgi:hypothetical protein